MKDFCKIHAVVSANRPTAQRKRMKTSTATLILKQIVSHRFRFASAISSGVSCRYFFSRMEREGRPDAAAYGSVTSRSHFRFAFAF